MIASFQHLENDDDVCLLQAAVLMQQALDLLDLAGETRSAIHLQHAFDLLAQRLPDFGEPN
jgi:hypothetical protein